MTRKKSYGSNRVCVPLSLLFLACYVVCWPVKLHADTQKQLQVEQLNQLVGQISVHLVSAGERTAMLRALRMRQMLLMEVADTAPAAIYAHTLDRAVSERILALLPEAGPLLEAEGSWEGELNEVIEDDFGRHRTKTHRFITTNQGEQFQILNNADLPSSNHSCPPQVRVRGLRVGRLVYAMATEQVIPHATASSCSPVGEQQVAVVLISYPSYPLNAGWTAPSANSLMFGSSSSLAGYISEVSYGKASVTGQVFGPYKIDTDFTCFPDIGMLWASLLRAAATTIDFRAYRRVILITPFVGDCSGQNAGESSACQSFPLTTGETTQLSVSAVAIASDHPIQEALPTVIHEFGHALGISKHASTLSYSREPVGLLEEGGIHDEYGDWFSTMGGFVCVSGQCTTGHYNAVHKVQLGWLDDNTDVARIDAPGTYTVGPLESVSVRTPKALRVRRPGTDRYLWLEYRQPVGQDATLTLWTGAAYGGLIIHYQDAPGFEGTSYSHLLDYHAQTPGDFRDSALASGETWSDPNSPLTLTIGLPTPDGIEVTVSMDTSCATASAPSSVSPSGQSLTITVQAPASCPWSAVSQSSWLTVTSGGTGSGNGQVTLSAAQNSGVDPRTGTLAVGRGQIALTQPPTKVLLYSSFGARNTWDSTTGAPIGRVSLGGPSYSAAVPFQAAVTAPLSVIELGIIRTGDLSKGQLSVAIYNDNAGRPGVALETIVLDVSLLNSSLSSVVPISSMVHPILLSGQQYWVGLIPSYTQASSQLLCAWGTNSIGLKSDVMNRSDQSSEWTHAGVAQLALRISGDLTPGVMLSSLANSASYQSGAVAPGELVILFGNALGPATLAFGTLQSGYLSTSVEGTRVLFDGVPAPVLYARTDIVAAFAPFRLAGLGATHIQVLSGAMVSNALTVPVTAAVPGIFSSDGSGQGQGAILDQDGTINSAGNPASRGDVIAFYATGSGQTNPGGSDGHVAASSFPMPLLNPTVTIGGHTAEILYFGTAPLSIEGIIQVNARIPLVVPPGNLPLTLSVGNVVNQQKITVAVK